MSEKEGAIMKKTLISSVIIIMMICIGSAVYFSFSALEIGEKSSDYAVNVLPGASLKLVDVSVKDKQITVEYSYTGHTSLVYGEYHHFEVWKEDGWYTLLPKNKNLVTLDIAYHVGSGKTVQETYGWSGLGRLAKGRYRFVQKVSEELDKADYMKDYMLAVEFEIE